MAKCVANFERNTQAFKDLVELHGETAAEGIWSHFNGRPPARAYQNLDRPWEEVLASEFTEANRFDADHTAQIVDSLTYEFLNSVKEKGATKLLGTKTRRGDLPTKFLRNSYITLDGKPLKEKKAKELFELERQLLEGDNLEDEAYNAILDKLSEKAAQYQVEMNEEGEFVGIDGTTEARDVYFDIYRYWNGGIGTSGKTKAQIESDIRNNNFDVIGWREKLQARIEQAGYKLVQTKEGEIEFEDDTDVIEKIYGKSHFQEDPSTKLSGRIRQVLSTIPSGTTNFLGYESYIPASQVFRDLAIEFANAPNVQSMVLRLENFAKYKPEYAPVVEFMKSMNKSEAAAFRVAFGMAAQEFVMMQVKEVDGSPVITMFNPNMATVKQRTLTKWARNAVEESLPKATAIYKKVGKQLEFKDPTLISRLKKNVKVALEARTAEEITPEHTTALATALWGMGIDLSTTGTIESQINNIALLVREGRTLPIAGTAKLVKGKEMFNHLLGSGNKSLNFLANGFVKTEYKKGKVAFGEANRVIQNVHESSRRSAVQHYSEFAELFKTSVGEAFVSPSGKLIYPINLPTHLSDLVSTLAAPGALNVGDGTRKKEMLEMYESSKALNPDAAGLHKSALLQALGRPEFAEKFKVVDFSGLRDSTNQLIEYENFTESSSLGVRLTAWLNNGNDTLMFIPVSTQADRGRLSFLTLPRWSATSANKTVFGVAPGKNAKKNLVKSLIIQELSRISEARKVLADNTEEGVAKRARNSNYYAQGPNGLSKAIDSAFMSLTARDAEGNQIVTDRLVEARPDVNQPAFLSSFIEEYLKGESSVHMHEDLYLEINRALDEMAEGVIAYTEEKAKDLASDIRNLKLAPAKASFYKNKKDLPAGVTDIKTFTEAYTFDDMLGRIEMQRLFRGPLAQFKNITDFYKRMALITSPGLKPALASDLAQFKEVVGVSNYGMPTTYNEVVVEDLQLDLNEEQKKRADETATQLADALKEAGYPADVAERAREAYSPNELDGTDAQAVITLDHYKDIQQGLSSWGANEEAAFRAYKDPTSPSYGKFEYQEGFVPAGSKAGQVIPINALKPVMDSLENVDGVIALDISKNSYHVLLASETQGNPLKDEIRKRMEAVGEYEGLAPIHVMNFTTAKKAKKSNILRLQSEGTQSPEAQMEQLKSTLKGAVHNSVKSADLRFPQVIPPKGKSDQITFNTQIRKNMLANVADDNTYDLGDQVVDGKNVKQLYHNAINEKLKRDMSTLKKELGIHKVESAKTVEDKIEAIRSVHTRLRRIVADEIDSRDLHDNYLKALELIEDEIGRVRFKMPLDFPVFYDRLERVILGVAENRVIKQKIRGEETVQVADLGGYGTSTELKFYGIERDSQGRVKVGAMEVGVRSDIAKKLGLQEGQELDPEKAKMLGYRIPQQGKSSVALLKVAKILPNNYTKAIIVPAQMTALMGSDFDVDKLLLVFPEVDKKTGERVRPDYNALLDPNDDTKVSTLSNKALNNIVFDVFESIQSSVHHLEETILPLDEPFLEQVANELADVDALMDVDFNDYRTEVDMGIRNTLGIALRGLWANGLSGHAVASHGDVYVNPRFQIKIKGTAETIEGKYLRSVGHPGIRDFDASTPVNKIINRYLSAAVDAGKKPFQFILEDKIITFPIELYWTTFVGDTTTLHQFLNHPTIKEAIDQVQTIHNGNSSKFKSVFRTLKGVTLPSAKEWNNQSTIEMTTAELKEGSMSPTDAAVNFLLFLEAGRELKHLFKVITPDTLRRMNSVDGLKSYRSAKNRFNPQASMRNYKIFSTADGGNILDQFMDTSGAFGLEAGFSEAFADIELDIAGKLLPSVSSPAMRELDKQYLLATGKDSASSEEFRELRKAAMLHAMTAEGSPIREFFENTHTLSAYGTNTNLVQTFEAALAEFPKLAENKFIERFQSNKDNETEAIPLLEFDTSRKMTKVEKDTIVEDARKLYTEAYRYANNPESADEVRAIQNLAEDLYMNNLIVNGFRSTPTSYLDLIPAEFFTEPRFLRYGVNKGERTKSIVDHFRDQDFSDPSYFDGFIVDYLRQHGTRWIGGQEVLSNSQYVKSKLSSVYPVPSYLSNPPLYRVYRNAETREAGVYRLATSGKNKYYYRLNPLGGRIMEAGRIGVPSQINLEGLESEVVSLRDIMTISNGQAMTAGPTKQRAIDQPTGADRTDIICN